MSFHALSWLTPEPRRRVVLCAWRTAEPKARMERCKLGRASISADVEYRAHLLHWPTAPETPSAHRDESLVWPLVLGQLTTWLEVKWLSAESTIAAEGGGGIS